MSQGITTSSGIVLARGDNGGGGGNDGLSRPFSVHLTSCTVQGGRWGGGGRWREETP